MINPPWTRAAEQPEFSQAAKVAAAAALILGAGCQATAFLITPAPMDTTEWLRLVAENPGPAQLSKLFDVLAMPFLIASAAVYIALGHRHSPKLAWTSGIALAGGFTGLAMLQGWEVLAYNLVADDVASPATVATAIDGIAASPAGLTVQLLFFVVGGLGLLATLVSLWRSQVAPRLYVLVVLAGFLIDVFGRPVEGHVVMFAAAAWLAAAILTATPVNHRTPTGISVGVS